MVEDAYLLHTHSCLKLIWLGTENISESKGLMFELSSIFWEEKFLAF